MIKDNEKNCPYNYPKGYKVIADGACHLCEIKNYQNCEIYLSQENGLLETSKLTKQLKVMI